MALIQFPSQLFEKQKMKLLNTSNRREIRGHDYKILDNAPCVNNSYHPCPVRDGPSISLKLRGYCPLYLNRNPNPNPNLNLNLNLLV